MVAAASLATGDRFSPGWGGKNRSQVAFVGGVEERGLGGGMCVARQMDVDCGDGDGDGWMVLESMTMEACDGDVVFVVDVGLRKRG